MKSDPPAIVAVIAALVALAGVVLQYLNARGWEARRWLRDNRLPHYSKFLLAANRYFSLLQWRQDPQLKPELPVPEPGRLPSSIVGECQESMREAFAGMQLLGPGDVVATARDMINVLYAWDRDDPVGSTGEKLRDFDDFEGRYRKERKLLIGQAGVALGRYSLWNRARSRLLSWMRSTTRGPSPSAGS